MIKVRFLLPYRLAVTILAMTLGLSPGTSQASSPRATVDCRDDSDLPQIHLIYAIPSDGCDQELDKNGSIRASVASAQSWLAKESGGPRLRFDPLSPPKIPRRRTWGRFPRGAGPSLITGRPESPLRGASVGYEAPARRSL